MFPLQVENTPGLVVLRTGVQALAMHAQSFKKRGEVFRTPTERRSIIWYAETGRACGHTAVVEGTDEAWNYLRTHVTASVASIVVELTV